MTQCQQKYCLGIEGTANKLSIGILDQYGNILANVRSTFTPPLGQGFQPGQLEEHHRQHITKLIKEAFQQTNIQYTDIQRIAYSHAPGIGRALNVVQIEAKTLAQLWNIPLVPVNHCIAHIEMGRLRSNFKNPVALYASGGNTQVLAYQSGRYRIFGETTDIGVGNYLDRFARTICIGGEQPGLEIEKLARKHVELEKQQGRDIPSLTDIYLMPCIKGTDFSLGGLNSKIEKFWLENTKDKSEEEKELLRCQLCYTVQEYTYSALTEIVERCCSNLDINEIIAVGGVGCNLRLQEMLRSMIEARGGKLGAMDESFCIDNGAMIAWAGWLQDIINIDDCKISQRERTDQIEARWRFNEQ